MFVPLVIFYILLLDVTIIALLLILKNAIDSCDVDSKGLGHRAH